MIDNLFCSLSCKNLDKKLKLATKKYVVVPQPQEELKKKLVIDRKFILAKLKDKICKRNQRLPSFQIENEAQHVDLSKVEKPSNETCLLPPPIPITVKSSFQKSEKKRKSIRQQSTTSIKKV